MTLPAFIVSLNTCLDKKQQQQQQKSETNFLIAKRIKLELI
jgi:hypothetical protein